MYPTVVSAVMFSLLNNKPPESNAGFTAPLSEVFYFESVLLLYSKIKNYQFVLFML